MFIPRKGHVFLDTDLSQAEARVVALLANDFELLNLFERGVDIHRLTASWLFNVPWERVEKNPKLITNEQRFVGKTGRHMCDYDATWSRLQQEIMTNARKFHIDVSISAWRAKEIIRIFHQYSPKIRGVFHEDVRKALVDSKQFFINAYGRPRLFLERWGDDLFKEAYAHIPQSSVSDHLKSAMVKTKRRLPWLLVCLESHDAFLSQIPDNRDQIAEAVGVIKEELERPLDFSRCTLKRGLLKIPCEVKVGYNYKDMGKYERAA